MSLDEFVKFFTSSPFSSWIQAGLVIIVAVGIAKVITRFVAKAAKRIGVEEGARRTLNTILSIIVYFFAMVIALGFFGVDLSAMVTAVGLVSMV